MTAYNYERFDDYVEAGDELREFGAFPSGVHAGEAAPDGVLIRLEGGAPVRLSELWAERPVALEFGSLS